MTISGVITTAGRIAQAKGWTETVAGLTYRNAISYFVYGEGGYQTTPVASEIIGVGNGSQTVFNLTTDNTPIERGTFAFTAGAVAATDNGNGTIAAPGVSGTIKYKTGQIKLTFDSAVANATNIVAAYDYRSAQMSPSTGLLKTRAQMTPTDPADPLHLAWFKKNLVLGVGQGGKSYQDSVSPRLVAQMFLDVDEFIDDGRGESPFLYEVGLFDSEDSMIAYATFYPPVVKNGSTQVNKICNLVP